MTTLASSGFGRYFPGPGRNRAVRVRLLSELKGRILDVRRDSSFEQGIAIHRAVRLYRLERRLTTYFPDRGKISKQAGILEVNQEASRLTRKLRSAKSGRGDGYSDK